ncbi:cupin domain-containing protein [Gracilimonas mengyeensis]|uniref:Cupin domain-containing protein n=1 Tax=Gracilimonas mengyeensis TaxID=1302730 RepID=A0A521EKX4_9BACT|nr:cupin domain-containing protein [Gracilimonas mengyeensis]SMO84563.1 Cupin domain-containing protein [Gracilimonas mengyeensis]
MSRTKLSEDEKEKLDNLLQPIVKAEVHHYGSDRTEVARYDRREQMYGGDGIVYLLQMFEPEELVNNRIGAYMILPTAKDSCGFHTHGTRKEEEIYLVMHGTGIYLEKDEWEAEEREYPISKGSITTVRGEAFHAVKNTGDEPLVIFVITTNEPASE